MNTKRFHEMLREHDLDFFAPLSRKHLLSKQILSGGVNMNSKHFKAFIFLVISLIIVCAVWLVGGAIAQESRYPERQIDVIVGTGPGGSVDIGARIIIDELTKELKVPISPDSCQVNHVDSHSKRSLL